MDTIPVSYSEFAAASRDYPVVFGTLFIFTLIGLIAHLLRDLSYPLLDPRVKFD